MRSRQRVRGLAQQTVGGSEGQGAVRRRLRERGRVF